jgi:membrane-bound serine protease (ClpP class)
MTLKERILSKLMDPNLAFLLFILGAFAIFAEFNHPGAVLPGVVGTISILLALFALNLLPTRYAALALLLAAFALFALEAKYATHGILGIGGVICMALGALFLVDGPIPEMRVHLWTALGASIPVGIIAVFLTTLVLRARRNRVVTGSKAWSARSASRGRSSRRGAKCSCMASCGTPPQARPWPRGRGCACGRSTGFN